MFDDHFQQHVRILGADNLPSIVCIPAFGDESDAYTPLANTRLAECFRLVLMELPGFGGTQPLSGPTTLKALSEYVLHLAQREGARILLAHSVASITASLAARGAPGAIDTIISLEGNLTPADAYYSGTAADFDDAEVFKATFLNRLEDIQKSDTGIARFREAVARADATALWQLGCDSRSFSASHSPGAVLCENARVIYLYDVKNTPADTLSWIESHPIEAYKLEGVSHWMATEQPDVTADAILQAFGAVTPG